MTSAIIPARGGSKSIPRKNLKLLAGLPLIAHTITAARQARAIRQVYVTTDDAEIAAVSRHYGAEVIERPAALASDTASSESAVIHALEVMAKSFNDVPEIAVFLQCTTPFTTAAHIDGLVAKRAAEDADCALIVRRTHAFLWTTGTDGVPTGVNHDYRARPRRQDRQAEFIETGAGYAFKRDGFLAARHRFFGKLALYEALDVPALEIDDPEDFERIEALMRARPPQSGRPLPDALDLLVFDFDGVMTDDRVFVDETGREGVFCSRGDGLGLEMMRKAGLPMLVLSKEKNPVVAARCKKLGLECVQGIDDKLTRLKQLCAERGLRLSHCIYMGNDVNDLPCMTAVGFAAAPADARGEAKAKADLIVTELGGKGAVRALCDLLLQRYAKGAAS